VAASRIDLSMPRPRFGGFVSAGLRSGARWYRPQALKRGEKHEFPWPAGGQVQRPRSGVAGQTPRDSEQLVAQRSCGPGRRVGEAERVGPAREVVRETGDHCPGAVGAVMPGGEVRERLVFEVADDELDLGVLAML